MLEKLRESRENYGVVEGSLWKSGGIFFWRTSGKFEGFLETLGKFIEVRGTSGQFQELWRIS